MINKNWQAFVKKPFVIAGPCSAESESQVMETATALSKIKEVKIFRAGIWKPRTRPNSFEGIGLVALEWMKNVYPETGLLTSVEVANAQHVELALKAGINILWLGARTTVNPFYVQEIADALKGTGIPVMVKNPIHPELQLWQGAIERIYNAGIDQIAAIHRGFYTYDKTLYRNNPHWDIAIQLKMWQPDLPIICDPSHITGRRDLIKIVSQKALDLDFQGLMIETHPNPDKALSDAAQQITPDTLKEILADLVYRDIKITNKEFRSQLEELRSEIDKIDENLLEILAHRFEMIEKIGTYKRENNVAILQLERFMEILKTRSEIGEKLKLNEEFVKQLFDHIHQESIQKQTEILSQEAKVNRV